LTPPTSEADVDAVLTANERFYQAFEAADLDAMSDLWERSDRSTCTHPGWTTLRGWGKISASFFALFQSQRLQFLLTEERAHVVGDMAWVTVDENLLGDQGGATVSAVNIFVRGTSPGEWRLVCHHGSVIGSSIPQ
jgi:ketosteroid isomerase-like protein